MIFPCLIKHSSNFLGAAIVATALLATPSIAGTVMLKSTPVSSLTAKNASAMATIDELGLLRQQNAKLKALVKNLSARLLEANTKRTFCADPAISSNQAGQTRDCTPFACDYPSGTCLNRSCGASDDCAPGYTCDEHRQCVNAMALPKGLEN